MSGYVLGPDEVDRQSAGRVGGKGVWLGKPAPAPAPRDRGSGSTPEGATSSC